MRKKLISPMTLATSVALTLAAPLYAKLQTTEPSVRYAEEFSAPAYLPQAAKSSAGQAAKGFAVVTTLQQKQLLDSALDYQVMAVKSSLLGKHYYLQQTYAGIPIVQQGAVASFSHKNGALYKMHDFSLSLSALEIESPSQKAFSEKLAVNKAWDYLVPQGELLSLPKVELVYLQKGKSLVLAYQVDLSLSEPMGAWRQYVALSSGKVVRALRLDRPHKASSATLGIGGKLTARHGLSKRQSYAQAELQLQTKMAQQRTASTATRAIVDGTGQVFDPDPRTTLNDASLEDRSASALFDPAYQTRVLRDITLDDVDGTFALIGPYVQIIDFEAPTTRPTTTADGNWVGKRGEATFYDAMTYYHIDENQRYLRDLGFTGDRAIQGGSIEVDADAANGDDNSYFNPIDNRLAFGHGGVPDNEDADVIIHEYGHAIHMDINPQWGGGDTGAIGEGFGDYWAASYSLGKTNGATFNPAWVFTWDGHNEYWPGRVLDRVDYRYDPTQTYEAHEMIDGQPDYSDELWSTPIYQAMLELVDAGVERAEVDQIIIEAQFGLGYGIAMPDMADSIVRTAYALYPNGPHAQTFAKWFEQMNMLGTQALALEAVVYTEAGINGVADPGETVSIKLPLTNPNIYSATAVSGELSSAANTIAILQDVSDYENLSGFATGSNIDDFQFKINEGLACGNDVSLSYAVNYELATDPAQPLTDNFTVTFNLGERELNSTASSESTAIPDNDPAGIRQTITVSGAGTRVDDLFRIYLDISHSYRGDLTIQLTSPEGTVVTLKSPDGDEAVANIVGYFPTDFVPAESLSAFDGQDLNGDWVLSISDNAADDVGTLNSWIIETSTPSVCEDIPTRDDERRDEAEKLLLGLAAILLFGIGAGSAPAWVIGLLLLAPLRRRRRD